MRFLPHDSSVEVSDFDALEGDLDVWCAGQPASFDAAALAVVAP